MMHILTEEEIEEKQKELMQFCKDNPCLMGNYMLTIKGIRKECLNPIGKRK